MSYVAVFSREMIKQFRKLARDKHTKEILTTMLDGLERDGPSAGVLLDARLHIYELKNKSPPLRIYYRPVPGTKKIQVFSYELKTSPRKQRRTITKLKERLRSRDPFE